MKYKLKEVDVVKLGTMIGACYGLLSLLFIPFFCLAMIIPLLVQSPHTNDALSPVLAIVFGVISIFVFPIIYGIMGFIAGALLGLIYNLLARLIGGIEFTVEPI